MTIYVGNLSYRATEESLQELFSEYGEVTSAKIMTDKMSGRSKGFGFIEMANDDQANAAISGLHEKDFMERKLIVNQARPRTENGGGGGPRRSFNRGGGGGGFNRGGGGGNRGGGNRY